MLLKNTNRNQCKTKISLIVFAIQIFILASIGPVSTVWGLVPKITDKKINAAIEKNLYLNNISLNALHIEVNTQNGIVTVSGTVENLIAKDRIVQIVQTIQGVRAVVDRIAVIPAKRSDEQIAKDLKQALKQDPATDAHEIIVNVEAGVVTLGGKVDSQQEKILASEVAKSVRGVKKIKNEIKTENPSTRPDREIQADIQRHLESNVWIFDQAIQVRVKNGKVILSGVVGSEEEKNRVVFNSWTSGVKEVDDDALIVNSWIRKDDLRRVEPVEILEDDQIRKTVEEALALDPRVDAFSIDIKVESGVATLKGKVNHFMTKVVAEQDASNTVGVRQVVNDLEVANEQAVPDEEKLTAMVKQALASHPLTSDFDIKVKVKENTVGLYGEINSLKDKALVEKVASVVRGVKQIENNLTVKSTWPWKKDEDIYEDVRDELFWSFLVDEDAILVTVEKGVVRLTGKAADWKEVRAAVNNAFEGGAKIVKAELKLDNGVITNAIFDYRDIPVGL